MTARGRRWLIASAFGIVTPPLAVYSLPFFEYLLYPGYLLASPVWGTGIHSDHLGPIGLPAFIATVYLGTAGFWAVIVYVLMARPWRT